jgi:hypothetical protein
MTECKHGLKHGCAYCHAAPRTAAVRPITEKRRSRGARLSEQMNDRMTALKRRLRELRGE